MPVQRPTVPPCCSKVKTSSTPTSASRDRSRFARRRRAGQSISGENPRLITALSLVRIQPGLPFPSIRPHPLSPPPAQPWKDGRLVLKNGLRGAFQDRRESGNAGIALAGQFELSIRYPVPDRPEGAGHFLGHPHPDLVIRRTKSGVFAIEAIDRFKRLAIGPTQETENLNQGRFVVLGRRLGHGFSGFGDSGEAAFGLLATGPLPSRETMARNSRSTTRHRTHQASPDLHALPDRRSAWRSSCPDRQSL